MTDPAIIEAAAQVLSAEFVHAPTSLAKRVLAAVTPLIEANALERAAKVVDDEDGNYSWAGEHRNMVLLQQHGFEIAAAIRALKPATPSPPDDSA